jgi:uncharacterized protein (DUF1810 family)
VSSFVANSNVAIFQFRLNRYRPRLLACAEAAITVKGRTAEEMFGDPDNLKRRSCATLFACVMPPGSVFHRLLDMFFRGVPDPRTLDLLGPDLADWCRGQTQESPLQDADDAYAGQMV